MGKHSMLIAAPIPRTSHRQQHLATMRRDSLQSLVAVHGDGICTPGDASSGSYRIAALQVVCSLALFQLLVNNFHEFID